MKLLLNRDQIDSIESTGHPYIGELQYLLGYINDEFPDRMLLKRWDDCWEICWDGLQSKIIKTELVDALVEFLIKNPRNS